MNDPDFRALLRVWPRAAPARRATSAVARLAGAIALFVVAATATALDATGGDVRIEHAFARATPPGARTAGVYLTVRNMGKAADRLVSAASPAAASADLHSMTMDGTLMRMRPVRAIDVAAGATAVLGSGGYHVMLVGLAKPLVAGETVPLTLTFEKAGRIDVSATVEPMTGAAAGHGAAHSP